MTDPRKIVEALNAFNHPQNGSDVWNFERDVPRYIATLLDAVVEERARYNYCVGTQRVWRLCKELAKWRTEALRELDLEGVWPRK